MTAVKSLKTLHRLLAVHGLLAGLLVAGSAVSATAQSQGTDSTTSQQSPQEAPPEAGGPQGDGGAIALPKKPEEKPAPKPEKPEIPKGMDTYTMRVDVPVVSLDVSVVTKDGLFVPGLKQGNFKVFEDGVQQQITGFQQTERPITAVMVVEFASTNYWMISDALRSAYTFASTLKPDDYVAVVTYDLRPHLLVDFTHDKRAIIGSLNTLWMPTFSETDVFDALYDTLDRLEGVEGRKYVILIGSGRDTFSKLTLDKTLKKVQATRDTTIYTVGTGQALRLRADAAGAMGPIQEIDYLQADNQMRTFARMTGGRAYFPRFMGELPEIFHDIQNTIRNQYTIAYHPSNPRQDGSFRKIKVELVDGNGQPLKMQDEKHKPVKYQIIARDGYRAKHEVE